MTKRTKVGIALLAVTAIVAIAPFIIAFFIKRTLIARSRERGIALTIESASPSIRGIVLTGLEGRIDDIPEANAKVDEIEIVLFGTRKALARSVRVEVRGSAELLRTRYAAWRSRTNPIPSTIPFDLEVSGIHASWVSAFGPESSVELFESSAHISADGNRANLASLVQVGFGRTTMQTIRMTYDEESRKGTFVAQPVSRSVAGASLRAEIDHEQIVTGSLTIPRGPLSAWLTDKRVLGHNPNVEIESTVVLTPPSQEGRAHVDLKVYGAKFQSGALPIDASVRIEAKRNPDDTIALERGEALFGPLKGELKGGLGIGSHIWSKLMFNATPIPCSRFITERRNAKAGSVEEMAGNATSLLEAAGIARLEGTVGLEAQLDLDLERSDRAQFHWKMLGGCAIALF